MFVVALDYEGLVEGFFVEVGRYTGSLKTELTHSSFNLGITLVFQGLHEGCAEVLHYGSV